MEKRAWFVRIIVPWALLPITWEGFVFEVVSIVLSINLTGVGMDHLEKGEKLLANIFIFSAVIVALTFVGFGIFRSRPLKRR